MNQIGNNQTKNKTNQVKLDKKMKKIGKKINQNIEKLKRPVHVTLFIEVATDKMRLF